MCIYIKAKVGVLQADLLHGDLGTQIPSSWGSTVPGAPESSVSIWHTLYFSSPSAWKGQASFVLIFQWEK